MTESIPLPSPLVSDRTQRSRYHRSGLDGGFVLQPRDHAVLRDLFPLRFAKAQALYLAAYAATATPAPVIGKNAPIHPETGMRNFARRLSHLWQAGYVGRFDPRASRYVAGSDFFVYTIEDGKASEVARSRKRYRAIPADEWQAIVETAAPVRDRAIAALVGIGFEADAVKHTIHNNTDLALKLTAGETSGVWHRLLASTVLSILFFGVRQRGRRLHALLPDGAVDLSFDEYVIDRAGKRERDSSGKDKTRNVPIKPDFFFAIDTDGYALEAETGTSGRAKIEQKVQRYLKLHKAFGVAGVRSALHLPDLTSFRVMFHCAHEARAAMIRDVISRACPRGTGLFLVSETKDLHLGDEPGGEKWSRDHFLKNLPVYDGTPIYTFLANRIAAPVFATITGRAHNVPMTASVSLL